MRIAPVLATMLLILPARGAEPELTFTPLFNGKDLAGWVPVNVAPDTFTVRDGVIHSTGVPTGILRTERQYENFVIELEWMHEKPAGNAGLFLWGDPLTAPGTPFARGIEVQILDDAYVTGEAKAKGLYTGHGDVFAIHGATMTPDRPHPAGWPRCLPSERRAKPAGQWNHYRVEARDGVVKLAVNGKVVSGGSMCRPRKGYICLESEGSPAQFRNIRIAELPSTNPKLEEVAPAAEDFRSLYTGVDLTSWKAEPGHKGHWVARDWTLAYDGKSEAADKNLWSDREYEDFELIVDWRFAIDPKKDRKPTSPGGVIFRGVPTDLGDFPMSAPANPPGGWNRTIYTVKGDRVTVVTNGQKTADDIRIVTLPPRGRIALRHGDVPMEFANLFIRELK